MSKKKIGLMVVIGISLLLFSGCKKRLPPEEVGVLFVNRLIYEKKDNRFEENFVNGDELGKQVEKERTAILKELATSFNQFGGVISEVETDKFLKSWFDNVQKNAKYEVKSVKEDKKNKAYDVKFSVKGIEFEKVYKETMDHLVEKMLADSDLANNNAKLGDLMISLLMEETKKATINSKPVTVEVSFKVAKKKWELDENELKKATSNLTLAFLTGYGDQKSYMNAMSQVISTSLADAQKQIDAEISGKKEDLEKEKELTEAEKKATEEEKKEEEVKKAQKKETVETTETYEDK